MKNKPEAGKAEISFSDQTMKGGKSFWGKKKEKKNEERKNERELNVFAQHKQESNRLKLDQKKEEEKMKWI